MGLKRFPPAAMAAPAALAKRRTHLPSRLVAQNAAYVREKLVGDPLYFKKMSGCQRPEFMLIGCSDSRVPMEVVLGLEPGEAFVHRNVANQILSSDLNMSSVSTTGFMYWV